MLLSDLGADVIKVEPPSGDEWRRYDPFEDGESRYFYALNRGKRSVALDLKSARGARAQSRLDRIRRRPRAQLPAGACPEFRPRLGERPRREPALRDRLRLGLRKLRPGLEPPGLRPDRPGAVRPPARRPAPRRRGPAPDRRARARRLHRRASRRARGDRRPARPQRARARPRGVAARRGAGAAGAALRGGGGARPRRLRRGRRPPPSGARPAAPSSRRSRPAPAALEALDPYYRAHACADGFIALACLNCGQRRQVCELLGLEDPFADNPQAEPADARGARAARRSRRAPWRTASRVSACARPWRRSPHGACPRARCGASASSSTTPRCARTASSRTVEQRGVGPVRLLGSLFKVDGAAAGRGPPGAGTRTSTPTSCSELPRADESRNGPAARRAHDRPRVDPALRRHAPRRAHLAARGRRERPGPGDPRVHPLPEGRRHGAARPAAPRVLRGTRLRGAARGPARQRRVRRPAPRRVPPPGAGGRGGGAPLDSGAALVHGRRRDVRDLLGRLQRAPGGGPPPAGAEGRDQPLLDGRPLRGRRALSRRRGAGARDALVGGVAALVQRDPPRPGGRGPGLARRLARADRQRRAVRVRVAPPPAA